MLIVSQKLFFTTALVVAFAWYINDSSSSRTELKNELLYPSLLKQINDVTSIEISGLGHRTEVIRNKSGWVVKNRDSYPAEKATIAKSLLEIAELRIIEAKSKSPKGHEALGLLPPDVDTSTSRKVLIKDKDGQTIIDLLIGNSVPDLKKNYILRGADSQSLLTRGRLGIATDPISWLDSELIDLASKRIKQIKVNGPDQREIYISKKNQEDDRFFLNNIPIGYETKSSVSLSNIASLTEQLRFINVGSLKKIQDAKVSRTILITTFDGLVIKILVRDKNEQEWVEFQFFSAESREIDANSLSKGDLKKTEEQLSAFQELDDLANKTDDWAFILPDYKRRTYQKSFASLIKKKQSEK